MESRGEESHMRLESQARDIKKVCFALKKWQKCRNISYQILVSALGHALIRPQNQLDVCRTHEEVRYRDRIELPPRVCSKNLCGLRRFLVRTETKPHQASLYCAKESSDPV